MLRAGTLLAQSMPCAIWLPKAFDRDSMPATKFSDQRQPNILKQLLSRAVKRHMDGCASLSLVAERASMLADTQSQSLLVDRVVREAALSCAFAAK